jgi:hypothetical protein
MPTPQIPKVSSDATLDELRDGIIGTHRYLTYLLSTLDTLNINRLDAKVIIAESITAGKLAADSVQTENLQAGAITTEKIDAGAVTADKITVGQLSAIAADLGHITAGLIESIEIYGSYIATRNGSFPRAEMSNTDDLFGAYFNANESIKIQADYGGGPSLNFIHAGDIVARLDMLLGYLETSAIGNYEINTSSNGNIYLNPGGSGEVQIRRPDFSRFKNQSTDLQTELDNKATSGISTGLSGSANGGIPIGTVLMVSGGGTVTWTGVPLHSHAQN